MIRALATACAVLSIALGAAACGSAASTATHHHASKPKAAATNSALAQKSIKDGESYGQEAGLSGYTAGLVKANCGVLRVENMPVGDLATQWMTGCMLTGLIAANGGG